MNYRFPDNGRGDACEEDHDGDGAPDVEDVCPDNGNIYRTDFRWVAFLYEIEILEFLVNDFSI